MNWLSYANCFFMVVHISAICVVKEINYMSSGRINRLQGCKYSCEIVIAQEKITGVKWTV
jgi:hypothetical protein